MKKNLLIFGVGLLAGILLMRQYKIMQAQTKVVQLGDKSNTVLQLQQDLNFLKPGINVQETGLYDKGTKKAVADLFAGTNALKNSEKGAVDKNFVIDLNLIITKK